MKFNPNMIPIIICFFFASCSNDTDDREKGYSKVDVTFLVTLPLPKQVDTYTRTYTDTDIKNMTLLVFDKDAKFMERIDVDEADLTMTPTGVNFSISMNATADNRIIHLVANARTADGTTDRLDLTTGLTVGALESAIIPNLRTPSLVSKTGTDVLMSNSMPLFMWGRIMLNGVTLVSRADGVKLLASTACVQVKKANSGTGLSDLTLSGITVHNGADQGYLAPAAYNAGAATPTVGKPMTIGTYLDYTKAWGTAGTEPLLYVYERNCTSANYMGVIIAASYKGQAGFYKVVMSNAAGIPVNVVRNHRYIITIVGVNGPGYANIATAASSAPSNNLKVSVTDDDEDFPCVLADGQHVQSLTNNHFALYGKTTGSTTTTAVDICTVYSSRNLSPVLASSVAWLKNLAATAVGGNKYKITGTFDSSGVSTTVSGALTLTCDNLKQTVQVSWSPVISNTNDNNSYVFDLVGASERNWTAGILNSSATGWLYLHPTASAASAFNGTLVSGSGMVTELNSKYSSHAYLHVASAGTNRRAELKMTSSVNNLPVVRKIVVAQ